MKTIVFLLLLTASILHADISTFNGEWVHWGWFGNNPKAGEVSGPVVKEYLKNNWGKVHPFTIQAEIGDPNHVEFFWKISPDLISAADATTSSYLVGGAKIASIALRFNSSGAGKVYLYSKDELIGRANCYTSAKREGKNSQLPTGNYKVLDKEELHISKEAHGARMPFALLLDEGKGIYLHQGDMSPSIGCIRLSRPVAKVLFSLVARGIPVKVVHDP